MQRQHGRPKLPAIAVALVALATASLAHADPPAAPSPARPIGLGLSPEAPPVPPAPGGRAPSFGAPTPRGEDPQFRLGGSLYAWEAVGLGRTPTPNPNGDTGLRLHVPAQSLGRQPFYPITGFTLRFEYGTNVLRSTVTFSVRAPRRELQGYDLPTNGSAFGQAYLTYSPQPLGKTRLTFRAGAFTESFAGTGLWGWGIFGPMLAVRGYGASAFAEHELTPDTRLSFEYGTLGVPGVPENFRRGDYTGWTETGLSSLVQHAHAGIQVGTDYLFKLHYAHATGTDERKYLVAEPRDGRFDSYIAEARWSRAPFGQIGVSGALWDLKNGKAVHDGIWWTTDWTKGAQDFSNKYLGSSSRGTGRVAAVSAQYTMSLAALLYHYAGRSFDGNGPDVRIALAGLGQTTLKSDVSEMNHASGYMLGADIQYQMLRWFGLSLRSYGESRDTVIATPFEDGSVVRATTSVARYNVFSVSPGLAFRTDWQSTDRIELIYSRRFYSDVVDNNSAQPLDHHVFALGAYLDF
jgi:hypothetical protein